MSDPLRTDGVRAHEIAADADRDAKIEQLLLVGLDHYFAAQYEHAINVWTRVLFLDRTHARARAYIERARSALAERQRESEELLQNGVEAFSRGEGDEARRLLNAAIEGGAPAEEALAVLDRLDRLEAVPPASAPAPARRELKLKLPLPGKTDRAPRSIMTTIAVSIALIVGLMAIGSFVLMSADRGEWATLAGLQGPPAVRTLTPQTHEPLPVPRRGELALARARNLATGGRLRDALVALDGVRATDPEKAEGDRLRADLQRQLLALIKPPSSGPEQKARHVP